MNRDQKAAVVEEIASEITDADAIFAIDYRGISVPQAAELRSRLREADARFRIVKNRLTKLAAEKAGRDELVGLLEGPVALTFVKGDTATAAKAISTFNREHELLEFKGGLVDGETLDADQFKSIARLPARDVLNGQFAAMVASPLTGLVRGLNQLIAGLAIQLSQIQEQGLVAGEPEPQPGPQADAAEEEAEGSEAEETSSEEPPTESSAEAEPDEPKPPQAEGDEGDTETETSNEEESD